MVKFQLVSQGIGKGTGGKTPVAVWTPGGSTCEDTHEDTPEDQAHV